MESTKINLKSSDGLYFDTEIKVAKMSGLIRNMLDDCCFIDEEGGELPLPNVSADILRRVLEWATHHQNDPISTDEDDNKERRTDDISPWDAQFLTVDQGTLFELILAANYLDIKGLLDVTCKTVANMIKGKSPDEIRKTFNIVNDFTTAEEEQIRQENEWCDEKEK